MTDVPMQEPIPPAQPDGSADLSAPPVHTFVFTGDGKEYFRIWIVNLCLTIATLGIYSAWAKVRRLQYFDRNTLLDGASFNFHGSPWAILRGRLVAVFALACYHFSFGFSTKAGAIVVLTIFLLFPWLIRAALRFRMRNTSYRGLRFDFAGTTGGAYLCFVAAFAIFLLPSIVVVLNPKSVWMPFMLLLVLYLCWPVIHGMIRRYQQANIVYGDCESRYGGSIFGLIKIYLLSLLVFIGAFIVIGVAAALIVGLAGKGPVGTAIGTVTGFVLGYGAFLTVICYAQVNIWNYVWNKTDFPRFTVRSNLQMGPYWILQAENLLLTVLTLGLFRPFAVVRTYRYRLSCIALKMHGAAEFDHIAQSASHEGGSASGDSMADLFDIDLSF